MLSGGPCRATSQKPPDSDDPSGGSGTCRERLKLGLLDGGFVKPGFGCCAQFSHALSF